MILLIILGGFSIVSAKNCSSNCLYGETFCNPSTLKCTFGCKPGWKEPDCVNRCGTNSCTACAVGSRGEECTSCPAGVFGPLCNIDCSEHCLHGYNDYTCDFFGNCLYGCDLRYTGSQCLDEHCPFDNCRRCDKFSSSSLYCSYCSEGYYWYPEKYRCYPCSQNCLQKGSICNHLSGHCVECQSGRFGEMCQHECGIKNCRICQRKNSKIYCERCKDGMYPSADGLTCLSCDSRHCMGMCDSFTGECKNGCQEGWYGEGYFCDKKCNIQNCNKCALNYYRNTECLSCIGGFYLHNEQCVKCPDNCLDSCDKHSPNCIHGCKAGNYGDRCEFQCSDHCVNHTCASDSGQCDCKQGWYGKTCDRNCPVHCVQCESFTDGKCKACEPQHYGLTCEKRCSPHCLPNSYSGYVYCDQDTGKCSNGCQQGFYNDTCENVCSQNCESQVCDAVSGKCTAGCTQNHYGDFCENPCPENCLHVLVGYKRTCNAANGRCLEGCAHGWYGEFCNKECNYRCKDKICDQQFGECLHGCIQGYTGVNCDLICRTGCNNDCSPNCYNNECDKSTQTCSAGCIKGWYGSSCLEICHRNCYGKSCEQDTGNCLGSCIDGYYGIKCDLSCNSNCLDNVCNKFTGTCSKGCKASYYGDMCTDACPGMCKDNLCDRFTGHCISCGLGKHGNSCNEDCILGTYGENCASKCGKCYDSQPCNTEHGTCPSGVGCEPGYTGIMCQEALQSEDDRTNENVNMDVVIGCSVAGFICIILLVLAIFFYSRTRNKAKRQKTEEPVVVYRESNVQIGEPNSINSSIQSDTLLLGDSNSRLNVNLQGEVYRTEMFTLYRGTIMKSGRQQNCCVKVTKLTELQEDKVALSHLATEYELITQCGHHLNIVQLLTTYQNRDVYCAALEICVETGLVPYLLKLRSESDDDTVKPVYLCKMVRFAIDICSALCHIHNMKITHRLIQAKHVYLTDTLVAKLGDFYCAEMEDEPSGELPPDSYRWTPVEALNYHRYSPLSDIWSFGVTFWEICSGARQPFEGVSVEEYRGMILDGSRLPKLPSIHGSMYKIMKTCWRYRPSDRPTAEQVLNLLLDLQPRFSKEQSVVYI